MADYKVGDVVSLDDMLSSEAKKEARRNLREDEFPWVLVFEKDGVKTTIKLVRASRKDGYWGEIIPELTVPTDEDLNKIIGEEDESQGNSVPDGTSPEGPKQN